MRSDKELKKIFDERVKTARGHMVFYHELTAEERERCFNLASGLKEGEEE